MNALLRRWITILTVSLLSIALTPPVTAEAECYDALSRLASALDASPEELTPEAASALSIAMEACGHASIATNTDARAHIGAGKATQLICQSGSLEGYGPLEVDIVIPPLLTVNRYQEVASESYTLRSNGDEQFTAGGSLMGFEASSGSGQGASHGTLYIAENSFPANTWGVSGACNTRHGSPCSGSGFAAAVLGTMEVWMSGYLTLC